MLPWVLCMSGLPGKDPQRPIALSSTLGYLSLDAWLLQPLCKGAHVGHTPASAHHLHAPSARQACLPMARSYLPSLPLHGSVPVSSLQLWSGVGSRLYPGLRSPEWLLGGVVQGRRLWPGTVTLPLRTLAHWHRKPSVQRPHHVTAIVMPILPADHVTLARPPPCPCPALLVPRLCLEHG